MRAAGAHQGLAPVLDVVRDPRWGRTEECIAEDAYLVGMIGCSYIRGLQGDDLRTGVAATVKHFAGHSFSEGGRNLAPAHIGPREMADVFLLPFEMAVKLANVRSVMNAYHDVDGVPAAASEELLTTILRQRWGFDGVVVSDYFSVLWLQMLHGVAADKADAAAMALRAGIDVELPTPDCYPLLDDGPDVDRALERVLALKRELGLLDRWVVDEERVARPRPAGASRSGSSAGRALDRVAEERRRTAVVTRHATSRAARAQRGVGRGPARQLQLRQPRGVVTPRRARPRCRRGHRRGRPA